MYKNLPDWEQRQFEKNRSLEMRKARQFAAMADKHDPDLIRINGGEKNGSTVF